MCRRSIRPCSSSSATSTTVKGAGSPVESVQSKSNQKLTTVRTSVDPIIVARSGGDKKWGGRHVKYDTLTPLANLHLALLDDVGVHLDRFVDSTGHAGEVMEPLTL